MGRWLCGHKNSSGFGGEKASPVVAMCSVFLVSRVAGRPKHYLPDWKVSLYLCHAVLLNQLRKMFSWHYDCHVTPQSTDVQKYKLFE
jgi:hypothetical protein